MKRSIPPLPLKTQRLVLRPASLQFAGAMQEAIDETFEDLHPWVPWAKEPQSLAVTQEYLEQAEQKYQAGEYFAISVFLRSRDEFVLGSGLHPRDWNVPKFEIGYWCRRSMQGQGYVTETVRALTSIAFLEMAANRVEIRCDSRNLRSSRVAERAGFHLEATLRSHARANDGSLRDTLIYVMLAEDFARGLDSYSS